MNKSVESQAIEFANQLTPIKNVVCPRNVINPGLYFGYMAGYAAATTNKLDAGNLVSKITNWFYHGNEDAEITAARNKIREQAKHWPTFKNF